VHGFVLLLNKDQSHLDFLSTGDVGLSTSVLFKFSVFKNIVLLVCCEFFYCTIWYWVYSWNKSYMLSFL